MGAPNRIDWKRMAPQLQEWNRLGLTIREQVEKCKAAGIDVNDAMLRDGRCRLGIKYPPSVGKGFEVQAVPTPNRPIDEIIRDQAERHREKMARWDVKHDGIRVSLDDPGPYGIVFFGDPHGDDDGCDFGRLCADMDLVKSTPHCYGLNLGDLSNNWIRALGHLYGVQHTTEDEAAEIVRYIVGYLDWLAVILGNHDKWSPLAAEICRNAGVTYVSHGAMFRITCGDRDLLIDARHTHRGHSMYNPAHAQLKRNYRGSKAHLIVGAHVHTSAYTMVRNGVTGHIGHALRVGTYKLADEYADTNGFDQDSIGPSVMAVICPDADDTGYVTVFHDLAQGAVFLEAMRNRKAA